MERLYKMSCNLHSYFVAEEGPGPYMFSKALKCFRSETFHRNPTDKEIVYREIASVEELGDDTKLFPWSSSNRRGLTCGQFLGQAQPSCDGKVVEIEGRKYKLTEMK